jgi:hypothetical protein
MKQLMRFFLIIALTGAPQTRLCADESLQSGPAIGERPKPFSVIGVTGPRRGQTHCYVCEAEDRPIAIVFTRTTAGPIASLIKKLDEALSTHQSVELRSWVVFLAESRGTLEPKIDQLVRQNSIGTLPLTLVEDRDGPPAYRIHRDAEVTVLFSVKQKLVASHAFKTNELTDARVLDVMSSLLKIVSKNE